MVIGNIIDHPKLENTFFSHHSDKKEKGKFPIHQTIDILFPQIPKIT